MEEVDAIIVHTLGSIGCDVEDVSGFHQFTTEFIVEAVARCLKVINNDLDIPYRLPPSMSARFRVGTSLANAITELGYSGEVGYQTFLYSNESDIRRVFMFLIDKLPKDTAQTTEEALGSSAILQRTIAAEVSRCLKNPWSPAYCKNKGVCWRGQPPILTREGCGGVHKHNASFISTAKGITDLTKPCSKQVRQYYQKHLPPVTCQPRNHRDVAASVLEDNALQYNAQQEWEAEWNQAGLTSRLSPNEYKQRKADRIKSRISNYIKESASQVDAAESGTKDFASFISSISDRAGSQPRTKGSRFTHTEKLQFGQGDEAAAAQMGVGEGPRANTEEDLQKSRQEEIDALQKQLEQLAADLDNMRIQMKKMAATKQQTEEQVVKMNKETSEKQESHLVRKRTLDLLPDAENNIQKLQGLVDGSAQRLVNLANQWEKHRVGLVQQIRELKDVSQTHAVEIAKTLEEIKGMREGMKGIAADIKTKEEMQKHLVAEYGRMTKDVNRSAYTRKIMEIVANIKKQNDEIGKVLVDTRGIQKEINQLSGKLDRTFAVTDELVFKDAKKDEAVRQAYKYLAALHENFNIVIKNVEDTGVIMREIRDLEDQIENEGKKKILSNLEKITADYQEMKKENQTLMSKLKKT